MRLAVDFDGVVVEQDRPYGDVTTPLRFVPDAKAGLYWLKRAGHVLLLWSGRSSPALLKDPELDPLVRVGVVRANRREWERMRPVHQARYDQMVAFVGRELPGVFDAIDDGAGGKPNVDLFIDDKCLRFGRGMHAAGWRELAHWYGDPRRKDAA